jgi:prepilin-type N-terminal cleavage/methylation domain-containing protein
MMSQASRGPISAQRGFTLTELLVAMALITFTMSTLSQAFVAGLESFRHLKAIGDLNEGLRTATHELRRDVLYTNHFAEEFIVEGLRSGVADPARASALQIEYKAIYEDAADLELRLRDVERQTVNPVARRLLGRTIEYLGGVKEQAAKMIVYLEWFKRFG